jgi:hypothetical protein
VNEVERALQSHVNTRWPEAGIVLMSPSSSDGRNHVLTLCRAQSTFQLGILITWPRTAFHRYHTDGPRPWCHRQSGFGPTLDSVPPEDLESSSDEGMPPPTESSHTDGDLPPDAESSWEEDEILWDESSWEWSWDESWDAIFGMIFGNTFGSILVDYWKYSWRYILGWLTGRLLGVCLPMIFAEPTFTHLMMPLLCN